MRKACKMLVVGVDTLKRDVVAAPFFDHVVGAAVEKVSFRYLSGLVARCTTQSGSKMISEEVLSISTDGTVSAYRCPRLIFRCIKHRLPCKVAFPGGYMYAS